jgi:hypothetical protein
LPFCSSQCITLPFYILYFFLFGYTVYVTFLVLSILSLLPYLATIAGVMKFNPKYKPHAQGAILMATLYIVFRIVAAFVIGFADPSTYDVFAFSLSMNILAGVFLFVSLSLGSSIHNGLRREIIDNAPPVQIIVAPAMTTTPIIVSTPTGTYPAYVMTTTTTAPASYIKEDQYMQAPPDDLPKYDSNSASSSVPPTYGSHMSQQPMAMPEPGHMEQPATAMPTPQPVYPPQPGNMGPPSLI